ncbi:MAG: hypothetical protein FVQ83_11425 [Chloroflexi bacterium]|nr:hypothetical protein [Chloroflexota bacterium]
MLKERTFSELVEGLLSEHIALWWECDTKIPDFDLSYTTKEKRGRETHADKLIEVLNAEIKHPPRDKNSQKATEAKIFSTFGSSARAALDFEDRHIDVLLSPEITSITTEFPRISRRFDSNISPADIFQANRNTWAMHGVQMLFGLPVELTPSIFAYSMIYPYSDNFLDDPRVLPDEKKAFNLRFARRLSGERVEPGNSRERCLYELVGMIENQYPRTDFPLVFESLLAIHRAQTKSIGLMRPDAAPYEVDILGVTIEKGGTAVLADGYLIAGDLTPAQAEFLFGYGVFLQIEDDLQDVLIDLSNGSQTIFSMTAKKWPLDALVNRTFHFGFKVLERMKCFDSPNLDPIKELLVISATLLPIAAVAASKHLFSKEYLREIQKRSPLRFSYLRNQGRKLARKHVSFMKLIEAFAKPEDDETISNFFMT